MSRFIHCALCDSPHCGSLHGCVRNKPQPKPIDWQSRAEAAEQSTWNAIDAMKALEARATAAEAREAKLREALEPFAGINLARDTIPFDFALWVLFARAAIEETQRGQG